ncbi:GAF domain-containing protein [bacterium]|nr:GAF domain-containing protein [bacterium]
MPRTQPNAETSPDRVRRSPARGLLQANARLEERVGELLRVQDVGRALASQLQSDRLVEACVDTVCEITDARTVSVLLLDPSGEILVVRARRSVDRRHVVGRRRALGDGIAGWVAERRAPLLVGDAREHPAVRGVPRGQGYASDSFAAVPLVAGTRLVGVLCATDKAEGRIFDERDLRLLLAIAAEAAIALDNARFVAAQRDRAFAAVCAVAESVEAKDAAMRGHARRVAGLAVRAGYEIGLSQHEIDTLRSAALIHDVGRVVVRDSALTNPGPLTADERASVHEHPVVGERVARELGFLEGALPLIRRHHERWDGRGYPDGLSGRAIDPLTRILTLADAFEAVTSERPHRRARTRRAALAELAEGAGAQFDPGLIEPFTEAVNGHFGGI